MNIRQAILHFGSASELARQLGVHRCTVSKWRKANEIPKLRQYQLEALTKGALRVKEKV